jgi:hypothetical protein
LPVSVGSTGRVIIGYHDGDEPNSISLAPSEAHTLAAQLIAAADEAESEPMFSEGDIAGVLDAFAEMNTVRKVLDHGSLGTDWFEGFRDELRALRKPRES